MTVSDFKRFCRPRTIEFEPPEDANIDDKIARRIFSRVDQMLLHECTKNPKLNGIFLIALAEDISTCDTFSDIVRYKSSFVKDTDAGKRRIQISNQETDTIFYFGENDIKIAKRLFDLIENSARHEFQTRAKSRTRE